MSSVITLDFEKWKAQQVAASQPVVLDEFVFAYVPDLDPAQAINRDEKLPAESQIVHRQAVNKTGLASENAVAYSVTLGTEVGNFDFNWIGLMNKASGVIGMIAHAPAQKKIKTAHGLQGNVLTRSFLLEFDGAATETAITTTAETWQIDFTARLMGIDEMQRLMNTDSYGEAAFFGESFSVVRQGEQYIVKKGLAYVGGLRGVLAFDQTLNSLRNTCVYANFSYQGNLVSQWQTVVKIIAMNEMKNYVDAAGYPHYAFAIARIDSDGNVTDLRPQGSLSDREIGRIKQDYATQQALINGLNGVRELAHTANDNANRRLEKSKNGADIQDKNAFIDHLGLRDTVRNAERLIGLPAGETRLLSGNHSTYLYVTDNNQTGSYNTRSGHVWAFDSTGTMTTGLIPIQCGGTGARTAEAALLALGAVPGYRAINGKSLTADIQLTAADVKAYPADDRLMNLPSGETRLLSGNKSTYLYVTDDRQTGSYNTLGGYVWSFNETGTMEAGLIPIKCGGTGARTAEEALAALGGLPRNRVGYALLDFGRIQRSQRIIRPNPFGHDTPCIVIAEVNRGYEKNIWLDTKWVYQNGGHGVAASCSAEGIVVQAGSVSFWATGADSGSSAGETSGKDSRDWPDVACRVHVWKVM
ncbi:phage tail protein [Xenorhabdus hominickii]|uniref:Tail protein n=1 Tax=Xenorhabdus hominickii TaxID=351679 RepID=A0A2G0QG79_XENHO|nr:phage tail protein [Xenorhabdus hominickii]AOM42242.1 hypothetical protein A9255_17770 [Xenorhabdus hominickii]PHM58243.1 tail protein [Xenorhabdus hominickii]